MQLDVFPDRMYLRRDIPVENMCRFYMLTVQPDLFGGASLVREWGRVGCSGKIRIDQYPDEGHAVNALADLTAKKRKRGYQQLPR